MNTLKTTTHVLIAFACAVAIQSKSFAEPANLAHHKTEVQAYHDSGAYQKELTQVITHARQYIDQRINANKMDNKPKKLAIVLDIDETSLSNYDSMLARDFAGNQQSIHNEMLAANAPAIEPMLQLYQDAQKNNVAVFFVTGRFSSEKEATIQNLKSANYDNWAGLYVRPDGYTEKSIVPYKSETRAAITKQGYTIIASIGDQKSDLMGGFAEKTFKLPNPYYYIP